MAIPTYTRRALRIALAAAFLASVAGAESEEIPVASAAAVETIDLVPDDKASFSAQHIFSPITGLFLGGPNYWYKDRQIRVDTTPPGAELDLFYVRANFQKRYEQATAPVDILLPSRIDAGKRDSVTVRAMLDGYRQSEVSVRVRSRETELMIELEPLANSLVAMTHTYFVGRGTLSFLTKEALTFRIQKAEGGFSVVLTQTGQTPAAAETLEGVHSAIVASLSPQQLGEDLVVRVKLTPEAQQGYETRSRQTYDPVRRVHTFALDIVPEDGGTGAVERARAALARIQTGSAGACAARFDAALREELDPAQLARALAPNGSFTDPYLRAALKRLGEVSPDGVIRIGDGSRYDPSKPIELSAAASQAADAIGYLALLRSFVSELEPPDHRRETLRGLVAPEVGASRFDAMLDAAETSERTCLAQARQGGSAAR